MTEYQNTHTIPTGLDNYPSITLVTAEMLSVEDTKLLLELLHMQREKIETLKAELKFFEPLLRNVEKAKDALDKKDKVE